MRYWHFLAVSLLVASSACLDPIVGTKCATGYEPCHGVCKVAGSCRTVDGGRELDAGGNARDYDAGILDGSTGQGNLDGQGAIDEGFHSSDGASDGASDKPLAADAFPNRNDTNADSCDALANEDAPTEQDLPVETDSPLQSDDAGPLVVVDAEPDADDSGPADTGDLDANSGDDGADEGAPLVAEDGGDSDAGEAGDDASELADSEVPTVDDGGVDSLLVCPEGLLACDDQCVDPKSDPANCGSCGNGCTTGVCNDGTCLVCDTPQSVCGRQCIDTFTDPDNCGGCGIPCMSGLCSNGLCEAAGTGRAIVIGHDYLTNRAAMNRILGNAVFLWPVNPVRLLVYQGDANPQAIAGADAAIAQVANATGRQYLPMITAADTVPTLLPYADVFLVYGQQMADDATLTQLGLDWSSALGTFVARGGTVVVLDGVYEGNSGTSQILAQAGLFLVSRGTDETGQICTVIARGDALATGLPKTGYRCEQNSTNVVVTDTGNVTPVVADGDKVVVVHKIF